MSWRCVWWREAPAVTGAGGIGGTSGPAERSGTPESRAPLEERRFGRAGDGAGLARRLPPIQDPPRLARQIAHARPPRTATARIATAAYHDRAAKKRCARICATSVMLAVNGTLMRGLALNRNMIEAGATFVREAVTAPAYRLWSIEDRHPAMIRAAAGGAAIARGGLGRYRPKGCRRSCCASRPASRSAR